MPEVAPGDQRQQQQPQRACLSRPGSLPLHRVPRLTPVGTCPRYRGHAAVPGTLCSPAGGLCRIGLTCAGTSPGVASLASGPLSYPRTLPTPAPGATHTDARYERLCGCGRAQAPRTHKLPASLLRLRVAPWTPPWRRRVARSSLSGLARGRHAALLRLRAAFWERHGEATKPRYPCLQFFILNSLFSISHPPPGLCYRDFQPAVIEHNAVGSRRGKWSLRAVLDCWISPSWRRI